MDILDLQHIRDRDIKNLSGGELQRFAIGVCCVKTADIYMFDEPSSYLDIRQRFVFRFFSFLFCPSSLPFSDEQAARRKGNQELVPSLKLCHCS